MRVAWIAVPLGAAAILAALKPEIVRGTFSSPESVLRVAALVAACILFSRLLRRVVSNALVRNSLIAVPAILLLWLNVAPYFQGDIKIPGSYPESFTTAADTATSTTAVVPTPVVPAPVVPEPAVPEPAAPEPEAVEAPAPPPAPTQPVQLTAGSFRGLDGHRGSGQASVFREPDGSHVVAFHNLSVSSVPDPVLYLVPGSDQDQVDGAIRLGRFDAERDRYEIPADADVSGPLTVLIWCQRFAVPVAGATQSPV